MAVSASDWYSSSPKDLRGKILVLLGEYGSYFPSYRLPEQLDRRFGSPVDEAACHDAVEALISQKLVSSSPEQPSMVKAMLGLDGPISVPEQPGKESEVMPYLEFYLNGDFRTVVEGSAGSGYEVIDTSHRGPATGTWRRPDFTVINVIDLPLLGRRQVDVHSFELKTEAGGSIPAVFEALSQARETHYGYLAWQLPEGSPRTADLPEIETTCNLHGIGLIVMRPALPRWSCRLAVRPRRQAIDDVAVHQFLNARLTPAEKKRLRAKASEAP